MKGSSETENCQLIKYVGELLATLYYQTQSKIIGDEAKENGGDAKIYVFSHKAKTSRQVQSQEFPTPKPKRIII